MKSLWAGFVFSTVFCASQAFAFGSAPQVDLCGAILNSNVAQASAALAQGQTLANTVCVDNGTQYSPLWYGLEENCLTDDMFAFLVKNGSNINEMNGSDTPVSYLIQNSQIALASTALDLGADPNRVSVYPSSISVVVNPAGLDLFTKLIDKGMKFQNLAINDLPDTGFWITAANALMAKLPGQPLFDENLAYLMVQRGDSLDMLNWAITNGLSFTSTDSNHPQSAYQVALGSSSLTFIQELLTATHIKLNDTDVFFALGNSATGVSDFVCANIPDASVQDTTGQTPLMLALLNGSDLTVIQELASKSRNLNLERQTAPTTALEIVASGYSADALTALLAAGADPNYVGQVYRDTALILAVQSRQTQIIQTLLPLSQKVLNQADATGQTAISYAATAGESAIVDSIADQAGTNVNVQDNTGRTPLMDAVTANSIPTVVTLLVHGACIKTEDSTGHTALQLATDASNADMVSVLNTYLEEPNHC